MRPLHPLAYRPLLAAALVAALLVGCDQQRIEKLEEGVASEADVRKQFGEPTQITEQADGARLLEYPRQPEGSTNYEIVIGTDGKMSSLRQLLTPANFAKVLPGMSQAEVRKLLGKPAKLHRYAAKPDEEVWEWRFQDGQRKKVFEATFDRERRVLASATADDPREALAGK